MKKKIKIENIRRIAVIQTAFIGDVVLSFPLIDSLKKIAPNAEITFITTPASFPMAGAVVSVDDIIAYDKRGEHRGYKGIKYIAGELKKASIDCIVSPHRSLRSTLISALSGAIYRIGFNKNACSFLYNYKIPYINHKHEIERNLSLLSAFDCDYVSFPKLNSVKFNISDKDKFHVHSMLSMRGISSHEKYIAIAPGSVWPTKRWIKENYIELSKMFLDYGIKPVLLGSDEDIELCGDIAKVSGAYNMAGETTLLQTIYLLSGAELAITNDSAPIHLSGLADCSVIAVFGPTSREFGFSPVGDGDIIIENEELDCRPCRIHGSKKCPIKTHECMTSILPDKVFKTAMKILDKK